MKRIGVLSASPIVCAAAVVCAAALIAVFAVVASTGIGDRSEKAGGPAAVGPSISTLSGPMELHSTAAAA